MPFKFGRESDRMVNMKGNSKNLFWYVSLIKELHQKNVFFLTKSTLAKQNLIRFINMKIRFFFFYHSNYRILNYISLISIKILFIYSCFKNFRILDCFKTSLIRAGNNLKKSSCICRGFPCHRTFHDFNFDLENAVLLRSENISLELGYIENVKIYNVDLVEIKSVFLIKLLKTKQRTQKVLRSAQSRLIKLDVSNF